MGRRSLPAYSAPKRVKKTFSRHDDNFAFAGCDGGEAVGRSSQVGRKPRTAPALETRQRLGSLASGISAMWPRNTSNTRFGVSPWRKSTVDPSAVRRLESAHNPLNTISGTITDRDVKVFMYHLQRLRRLPPFSLTTLSPLLADAASRWLAEMRSPPEPQHREEYRSPEPKNLRPPSPPFLHREGVWKVFLPDTE